MAHVFISYRHVEPDAGIASELATFLVARGVSVFRDTEIPIGAEWATTIDEQIGECKYMVVLLSQASVDSLHLREEVRRAHDRGLTILPICIDIEGELPYAIGAFVNSKQTRHLRRTSLGAACEEILSVTLDRHPADDAGLIEGEPYPETGTVSLDSPYYVRRQVDNKIEALLLRSGTTILLRGPRQVGKSSLLVRAEATARRHGQRVTRIDFQLVDDEHRQDLQSLLKHLAHVMAADFQTSVLPEHLWDDRLGSKKSLTRFMEVGVLKHAPSSVVLCLDEVDSAFGAKYCVDFFGMLRFWHNERATSQTWKQLHLIITHSTDPSLWINDLDMSPFNVGERYRLTDFSPGEVGDLAARHQLKTDVDGLLRLTGGHPYLIRKALYSMKTGSLTLDDLVATAASAEGPFGDHLLHLLNVVGEQESLRTAFQQILGTNRCESERAFQRLYGAGLVRGTSRTDASPRCELYRRYFTEHL